MVWLSSKCGMFSIKGLCSYLSNESTNVFPSGIVWNPWFPSRVNFFAWEVVWGRILTLDQLKKRWLMMSNRCYVSKGEEEMVDHILYFLEVVILWQLFYALFGIEWLMHSSVKFALLSWHRFFIGKKGKKAKGVTPLCLFWIIWIERNRRVLEDIERMVQAIK